MAKESGVISRTSAVIGDLVAGKIHDRNSISARFGVTVAAADRYIHQSLRVPGVVQVREGRRLSIRFDFGEAVPHPSHPAAVAACWAAGLSDVFVGSDYERGIREALAYVTQRARRSSEFKHVDRKFLFIARGGESSLPESAGHLDDLIDAVLRSRYANIEYVDFNGEQKTLLIQPLSMAIYDHQIYVIGVGPDASRHPYRLSRVKSVNVGSESFPYPDRAVYDPKELFHNSFGVFIDEEKPAVRVRVRLAERWRFYCRTHRWHPSQSIEDVPQGIVVSITARVCWELRAWILGFGSEAVVLEPPELVEEIRSTAGQMADNYNLGQLRLTDRVAPQRAKTPSRARRDRKAG